MEYATCPGSPDLVDGFLKQRHEIGSPTGGTDGASLAENVQPFTHPAQRLHDLDGVGVIDKLKSRQGEGYHQGGFEIQGERRRDGAI
jgi:hypothetical protein